MCSACPANAHASDKEPNDERGDYEQGMLFVGVNFANSPSHQLMHQPRRVEWTGSLKDHAHAAAMLIEGFDIICDLFVFPAMVFVARGVLHQNAVQLFDVIFSEWNVVP